MEIRQIRQVEDEPARALILEGLGEHFGTIDRDINREIFGFRPFDRDDADVHLEYFLTPDIRE